jgi:hypothetical protein
MRGQPHLHFGSIGNYLGIQLSAFFDQPLLAFVRLFECTVKFFIFDAEAL